MRGLRGVTFIELILAVSIFAIVAVAIYSTFGTGISAWGRAQKTRGLYQDVRLALGKMARDLENAVVYSQNNEFKSFVGEKDRVSFYSLVEIFQTVPVHYQLRKVTYSLDESSLERLAEDFPESVQVEPDENPAKQIFVENIDSLSFSYCYENEDVEPPYKWQDTWDSSQGIPQGVKIELKLKAEEEAVFSKHVFIPTGKKGKDEQ